MGETVGIADIQQQMHRRWRMVLIVPLIYLLGGVLLYRWHFLPEKGGEGFLPMGDLAYQMTLMLGGLFSLGLMGAIRRRERMFRLEFAGTSGPADFAPAYKSHQLTQFMACDLVALPGLGLFLLQGEPLALAVFTGLSFFSYLLAMPGRLPSSSHGENP